MTQVTWIILSLKFRNSLSRSLICSSVIFLFFIFSTQGKGEFTMEYKEHMPVSNDVQMQLVNSYKGTKEAE